MNIISGFSKLTKLEKINYLVDHFLNGSRFSKDKIKSFWHDSEVEQKVFDDFSENTITNFYAPYGVVPNFKLNDKIHCVTMVIEESSVVAASAKAAKFGLSVEALKLKLYLRLK